MKIKFRFLFFLSLVVIFASCIQDEPEYREADILTFTVDDSLYVESAITEDRILLVVNKGVDLSNLAPHYTLSPGAHCFPLSGDTLDFTNEQIYKVISEDGRYTKSYTVKAINHEVGEGEDGDGNVWKYLRYSFDEWKTDRFNSNIHSLTDELWSDANSGLRLPAASLGMTQFPTDSTHDCVAGGSAVLLQTLKGGVVFFKNYNIFAGSLLYGKFSANMDDALKSLKLGQKYPEENGKPRYFRGYYKYSHGPVFTDENGNTIAGKVDQMSMYAVIFKVAKGKAGDNTYLDGHTVLDSNAVIARAEWSAGGEGIVEKPGVNGYKYFSIPFVYTDDFDYENYNYKLTMVFSSSKDGNLYEGAVGSKLYVDEVVILTKPFEP